MKLLRLPGVFAPHSDSWLLARHVRDEPLAEGSEVLDLCTGSGLLALVAAKTRRAAVTAVDISRRAVITARLNARLNGTSVRAVRGNLFEPLPGRQFDLIVSNPPYLPTPEVSISPHGAARAWEAGPSGRLFLDRICREAPAHLRPGGALLLVHSSVCGERETLDALTEAGLDAHVLERQQGRLGKRLRARSDWLRERGLVTGEREEMLVIRAERKHAGAPSETVGWRDRQSSPAA